MYSYGSPHMAAQKQDDQHERTFSSYVRIQVVVLKTCLGRWTRSGERGSVISVLPAQYDDDDDDICIRYSRFSLSILFQKSLNYWLNCLLSALDKCRKLYEPLKLALWWFYSTFHQLESIRNYTGFLEK